MAAFAAMLMCNTTYSNTNIIKFADDTVVIVLITGGEESEYRIEVAGVCKVISP